VRILCKIIFFFTLILNTTTYAQDSTRRELKINLNNQVEYFKIQYNENWILNLVDSSGKVMFSYSDMKGMADSTFISVDEKINALDFYVLTKGDTIKTISFNLGKNKKENQLFDFSNQPQLVVNLIQFFQEKFPDFVLYHDDIYPTITIGGQKWMAKDLMTSRYSNGDAIEQVENDTTWKYVETGAWCWFNNDSIDHKGFGKLYNWHVVNDSRNVCPSGWRVPTDSDWAILTSHLGGENTAGLKLKTRKDKVWKNRVDYGNASGFDAMPGGVRYSNGSFFDKYYFGYYWSSTIDKPGFSWSRVIDNYNDFIIVSVGFQNNGFSIRCLKN
jgi:uncharacterized protein (TIGR02145 family)